MSEKVSYRAIASTTKITYLTMNTIGGASAIETVYPQRVGGRGEGVESGRLQEQHQEEREQSQSPERAQRSMPGRMQRWTAARPLNLSRSTLLDVEEKGRRQHVMLM